MEIGLYCACVLYTIRRTTIGLLDTVVQCTVLLSSVVECMGSLEAGSTPHEVMVIWHVVNGYQRSVVTKFRKSHFRFLQPVCFVLVCGVGVGPQGEFSL